MTPTFWGSNPSVLVFLNITCYSYNVEKKTINLPSFQQNMHILETSPYNTLFYSVIHDTKPLENSPSYLTPTKKIHLHLTPCVCVLRPGVVSWDWPLQAQLRRSAMPLWLHGDTEEPSMQLPNAPQAERLRWESDEARILIRHLRNKHTDFLAWGCYMGGFAKNHSVFDFFCKKNCWAQRLYILPWGIKPILVNMSCYQHPKPTTSYNICWLQRISLQEIDEKTRPKQFTWC